MDQIDDTTELWDDMADELAEREHEYECNLTTTAAQHGVSDEGTNK